MKRKIHRLRELRKATALALKARGASARSRHLKTGARLLEMDISTALSDRPLANDPFDRVEISRRRRRAGTYMRYSAGGAPCID